MASSLAHIKSVRVDHRGAATKKIADLEAALGATPIDIDIFKLMRAVLQEKLEVLKRLSEDIIALLTDEGEIITEVETAELISDSIRESLLKIQKVIGTMETATPTRPSTYRSSSRSTTESISRVRLPEIILRPFDANYANWLTFWDTYKASIHDNTDISDVVKFTYILSLLRGSAREAVAGLSLTLANYKEAVDILCKRFGDQTQMKARHMDALMSLEPVMSIQNLPSLRRLYDTVETHIRGLKTLGVSPESYRVLLSLVIMKKLLQDLRIVITRKITDNQWNLDSILEAVLDEIDAREQASISSVNRTKQDRDLPTGTALPTNTQSDANSHSNGSSSCSYCNESHNSTQCQTVSSVEDRKRILRKQGRCFNCLRKGT
uniref:Uncharacterized protein n=1 Tax=Amphimedon queenslandica TaxID=400682 RepID=A0A1X7V6B0_AMPQE